MTLKSFLEFLIEMSLDDAMKLFGLNEIPSSQEDLNKHFKKLALKHHPDLGGSEETMKLINQAKDLLDKNLGRKYTSYARNSSKSKTTAETDLNERMAHVIDVIFQTYDNFDVNAYKQYIELIFGVPFTVKKELSPNTKDVSSKTMFYSMNLEFSDKERDRIIILHFTIDKYKVHDDIYLRKGLSSNENTFSILMGSYIYVNGKKQVLTKDKYVRVNDSKIFTVPSILLPKTKLTKIAKGEVRKNSKLAKRDFEAMFTQKFDGKIISSSGSYSLYAITLNDSVVEISRNVLSDYGNPRNKFSWYNLEGVHDLPEKKFSYYKKLYDKRYIIDNYKHYTLPENQDTFDFFVKEFNELKRTGDKKNFMKKFSIKSKEFYDKTI